MNNEILVTRISVAFCLFALALFYRDIVLAVHAGDASAPHGIIVAVLITALVYGSLVYLLARCGYFQRNGQSLPSIIDDLGSGYAAAATPPRVCVLIPSYKEEIGVLRQTIVSAAMAEFPSRRIAVLIDDPASASGPERAALQRARELVVALQERFQIAATQFQDEHFAFSVRMRGICDIQAEIQRVADLYERLALWVESLGTDCRARELAADDHTDRFFIERIIVASASAHRVRARQLRESLYDVERLETEYRRLSTLLKVQITSFERKQYQNLSHAPNKAMNLNSYIGLMGRGFNITQVGGLSRLDECDLSIADFIVPDAEYLLTLDADSLVLPDYTLKLVDIMEKDRTIAVAQTPYSAIPGSPNPLERAAGAQTDLQYIVHQGFTAFNATFWVGANALLRLDALRDIRTTVFERGNVIPVFIQDRTVIEDTGSTIDLVRRGWRLHNHPERLAYSATPPDFGSLIIQRRRWSNGGLIIFPDLLRYTQKRERPRPLAMELLMRAHYLCSPALVGVSVLLLLLLPLDSSLESPWVAATALPYYALYARDLRLSRYRWRELPQVYALGLMLLPVNLAGVLRSVQQILTGRKSSFGRTPKIENRTPVPPLHVLLQLALVVVVGVIGTRYALGGHYYLALFCAVNFALMVTGMLLFIGPRHALVDLFAGWKWPRLLDRLTPLRNSKPAGGHVLPSIAQLHSNKDRVLGMDGLRAYAISLVFLVHFLSQYFNGSDGFRRIDFDNFQLAHADTAVDFFAYYFWASHYGVDLFFLLSGFLIFRLVSRQRFSYPEFLRNRFMRLYPAFAVALAIYCVYVALFWNQTYDWHTIAANLLMLQGLWELGIKPIIVPSWSLSFEWLFYLVFPLLLFLPIARGRICLRHLALVAAVVIAFIMPTGEHYIRFLMFLAGAGLACISADRMRANLQRIPDVIVLVVYGLANLLFVAQQDYYRFIPVYLVTSFLLVAKVVYGDGFLHRIFRSEILSRLGRVSYSFYLFHGLVIIIVCDHLAPMLRGLPEFVRFLVLLSCSFAFSAAVASVFYRLLERPYFERRHSRLSFEMSSTPSAGHFTDQR
jgi:peptidoglycan/LPS O-acetylase OafA/YrhL/cellulose synthase/poly-beta-1,6-N-acetylglucosamine synthase-like glycosyltransferase